MKKFEISKLKENPNGNELLLLFIDCIWGLFFMVGSLIKVILKFIRISSLLVLGIVLILLYVVIMLVSRLLGPLIVVMLGFGLWYLVTGETWLFSPLYIVAFTVFIAVVGFFRNNGNKHTRREES
jgi:hypothetical protein